MYLVLFFVLVLLVFLDGVLLESSLIYFFIMKLFILSPVIFYDFVLKCRIICLSLVVFFVIIVCGRRVLCVRGRLS